MPDSEALSYQLGSKKDPTGSLLASVSPSVSVPSQGCCADQKAGGMWKGIVNCTVLYEGQNQTVNQSIKALETIRQTDNAFYLPWPGWAGTHSAVCYAK